VLFRSVDGQALAGQGVGGPADDPRENELVMHTVHQEDGPIERSEESADVLHDAIEDAPDTFFGDNALPDRGKNGKADEVVHGMLRL
jgi:hypothetical protein